MYFTLKFRIMANFLYFKKIYFRTGQKWTFKKGIYVDFFMMDRLTNELKIRTHPFFFITLRPLVSVVMAILDFQLT